jgi:hypothetical protein
MAKKLAFVAIAALVGAAVAGVMSASAAGPSGQTYLDHTVKGTYVDLAAHGFSAGDEFVFHDVLKQGGTKKGTIDGVCKITDVLGPNSATDTCTAGAKLSNGQIEFQAAGKNLGTSKQSFKIAIVGGTDAYRTARGWAVSKPISQNNSNLTIYVLP